MPIDFEFGGVYLPPIAQALLLALPVLWVINLLLRRFKLFRFVWHEALLQAAIYTSIVAIIILWMGRMA